MQFEIAGVKRKLKNVVIPTGEGGEGLLIFADALARTTAGPENPVKPAGVQPIPGKKTLSVVDGRSYREVVNSVEPLSSMQARGSPDSLGKVQVWISIWGFDCHLWDLKVLNEIRPKVPRINLVLPIIGDQFGIIVKIEGGLEGLPEVVKIDVRGRTTSMFLCPE